MARKGFVQHIVDPSLGGHPLLKAFEDSLGDQGGNGHSETFSIAGVFREAQAWKKNFCEGRRTFDEQIKRGRVVGLNAAPSKVRVFFVNI